MKILRLFYSLILIIFFLLSSASCVVMNKHDNGLHKGWFKNSHNPHHQKSMKHGKSGENSTTIIIRTDFSASSDASTEIIKKNIEL